MYKHIFGIFLFIVKIINKMANIYLPNLNQNIGKDINELDQGSCNQSIYVSKTNSPADYLNKRDSKTAGLSEAAPETFQPQFSDSAHLSEILNTHEYSSPSRERFDYFVNLRRILNKIFMDLELRAEDYELCTLFEKKLLKQWLVRKHRLKPTHFVVQDEDLNSHDPFKFQTIVSLSGMTSSKRKNEMYEYVIKSFIDYQIELFRENNISLSNPQLSEKFHSMVAFFKHFFPEQTKSEEATKHVFSTFIKLNGLKNRKLGAYFGDDLKKYKKNYKFKKCVEYIKLNGDIKGRLAMYLCNGKNSRIVNSCKQIIQDKIKKKIDQMRDHFVFNSKKCKDTFLKDFIDKLQKSKSKLPMLVLDIRKYSENLLDILQNENGKIKY